MVKNSEDVHLGNIVGECSNEISIKVITDDFIRRANTLMSQFKLAPHSIKLVFNCKMHMPGMVKCRPTVAY